ncbi:pre-mRNA 3'-end processing factor CF II [Spathaspora passalidarum NRRL Y-27907]|uniref:Protein CFT1 n=1 Tax=Spathaspora passalidarum (strain NRRL Y-27907 / 11-Y1) TaxID=619300 RepID=G3AH14_SPAPN|nr:pre-mRNA 3'-end processing factor CF II [Spathaspora passalidarum NRRL Y-27907]EGW35444.1 pre-mRNA 3'-end processing factor CF II [Spathaspora passalidarum NRRL Y-27907]
MDAYHEFIEPSRVNNCVGCNFISPQSKHLIVAKGNLLQIFEPVLIKQQSTPTKPKYKLQIIGQFKLNGLITDLHPLRTVENPHLDYLIVSTKYAKFSIIKWNHHLHTISTVSLHYYEHAIRNSTFEKLGISELIVEPTFNSCSCLRFKNLLCFLPFAVSDEEEEEDDEEDMDLDNKKEKKEKLDINGKPADAVSFYDSSFIIDAQTLDSSIETVVDIQFMHNYREPTIAILSSKSNVWAGNLLKVKDNVSFQVMTLDLVSKSTVSVFKIDNLPYEIDRIIPLPSPLNGCLLLGCNEIFHVDNGGIIKRIAVNSFTSLVTASTKSYQDQTDLSLSLEDCCIIPIPGDHRVLMVLTTGQFFYINFELDGKAIKKVHIDTVDQALYSQIKLCYPGEVAVLDHNLLFFANENGNSPLVQFRYTDVDQKRITQEAAKEEKKEEKDDEEDEDDLYMDEENEEEQKQIISNSPIEFIHHDELINNGPISSFTLGTYSREKFKSNLPNPNYNEVCLVANAGTHELAKLNIITPTIQPNISFSLTFSQVNRMWNLNQKYLITSDDINSKSEIFQIEKSFARLNSKDFINDELTINMHELNNGKFILQVTPKQIVLYNNNFKKRLTLNDEIKDDEILSSILRDEFMMIFLASGDVMIFSINTYNETYTKIEIPKMLSDTIITTGYITNSHLLSAVSKDVNLLINRGTKRRHGSIGGAPPAKPTTGPKSKMFVLVTGDNRIVAFNRFHNQRCFQLNHVDKFTDNLTLAFFDPNQNAPDPFIKQIILNELGDRTHKEEYLTILTIGGEVIMYKLYFDGENYIFKKEKDLRITGAPENAYPLGTTIERRLVYFPNLNGYTSIFVTGIIPYLIMKPMHSIPRIFQFSKIPALSISAFSDSKIKNGLIFLDNSKNARICELSLDFTYEFNWPMRQIHIGDSIKSITYHETSNTYVVSTFREIPYDGLDEDGKLIVGTLPDKTPRPVAYKGSIKMISPLNWTVIDTIELDDTEVAMNVQSMMLDVGSSMKKFKNKKEFIVIGSGKYRNEDLVANGSFKIFEIVDIVPEPGKPETNHKFKEVFQEDTRGAVTSICGLSGRLLIAQGQKVIVRDVQDDGVVPVAFLDTAVYVSESKSLGNLLMLGDPLKSCWLVGFDAEPFRMIMLGKDLHHLNVSCGDFITKDEDIYMLIADNNNILHLIQYDPDDPQSLNGQRLISKSAFEIESTVSCMRKLPKIESSFEKSEIKFSPIDEFQIIGSTSDGSFFNVFPVDESSYRRMYILQQQLTDKEYHYCGLNPRLNRFGGAIELRDNETNTKPILDFGLIKRYAQLNEDRKRNLASKVSAKDIYVNIWQDIIEFEHSLQGL